MASCPSYSLASIKPPLAARPPVCSTFPPCPPPPFLPASHSAPVRPTFLSPHAPAPPHSPALPLTRGAAAPLWMPLASLGGWPPPLRPQPRRCRGVARPAPGAGHSSPRRHACGVHGWAPGGTRSLALARLCLGQGPRQPRGPVPCGQSGPRGERRRTVRLPAAPESLPQGSAPRNGAASARAHCGSGRDSAASVGGPHLMPPLPSARATPSLTRAAQIRRGRRTCAGACPRLPSPFFGQNRSLWGRKWPPRLNFAQKTGSEGAAGRLQLAPSVPLRVKLGATCLTAACLPGADSGPRPAPSRPRGRVRDWGQAFGLPRHGLPIL